MSRPSLLTRSIALRIALAMVPPVATVLTLFGVVTALREADLIEREMQRDALAVATSVARLVEVQQADSVEEALALVADVDRQLPHLEISVVEGVEHPQRADAVVVAVPAGPLSVVVAEPLDQRDAFLTRFLLADLVGIVVATSIACGFALAVGRAMVERRVDRITARLAEVGRGKHPKEPLGLGDDELGVLGVAVDEMTRQLAAAREQAAAELRARRHAQLQLRRADRLAAVGRTVSVFAHEIGTPLAVITGRADRLLRPAFGEDVHHHAEIVRQQADRIAGFVRRLLDHARHDERFDFERVDLVAVIDQAVPLVEDRAASASVTLEVRRPAGRIDVDGDAQALTQVVVNLLSNAVDASPAGARVIVLADVERCEVGQARQLPPDHVHLVVEDGGPGIPEELRDRVFDPFFTTKGPGEGTGLGLPIAAEIVQDHGGVVTLEESAGGGCRFVVHLPSGGTANG
jgi:two-component system NtrC family sensor kinase